MFNGSGPNCAKIWEYLHKVSPDYADDIESICAKDILSDNLGLTVIIPNKEFIKEFNKNIHEGGNASTARRMLMNTVIKRYLNKADDFNNESFKKSLPVRSGLSLPVDSIKGDKVMLGSGNCILVQDKDFKSPPGFEYAVWRVESGVFPTDTDFRMNIQKRGRRPKDKSVGGFIEDFVEEGGGGSDSESDVATTFGGGGRDVYMLQVGRLMKNTPDTTRVGIVAAILSQYRDELIRNKCATRNPLLCNAVSLYNWMSMYYPKVLDVVLPVTDIHPGINLMLLVLDPNSPITIDMLVGTKEKDDPVYISQGWGGAELCMDPYKEWSGYLNKASSMITNGEESMNKLLGFRKNLVKSTGLDYASSVELIANLYKDFQDTGKISGVDVYPQSTVQALYSGSKNIDRKVWQDQMRFIATCAFSGCCDAHIASGMDIDEELSQAVRFRPTQGYTSACTFTSLQNNYSSKEEYYAFLKWVFSTDLMYIPQSLNSKMATTTTAPYNGVEYGKICRTSILNNDYIKTQMVESMKGYSGPSANLTYLKQWAERDNKPKLGGKEPVPPPVNNLKGPVLPQPYRPLSKELSEDQPHTSYSTAIGEESGNYNEPVFNKGGPQFFANQMYGGVEETLVGDNLNIN